MDQYSDVTKTPELKVCYSESRIEQSTYIQHYHDSYEVAFFVNADLRIFIKDVQYDIHDGDLVFIDEYDIHRILYNTTTKYIRYVVNFKKEYVQPLLLALKADGLLDWFKNQPHKKIHLNLKERVEIQALFDALQNCDLSPTSTNDLSRAKAASNLVLLLIRISELFKGQSRDSHLNKRDKLIQEIVHFIDTNYMNPIDLDMLESQFYTDKFHISHIFKATTGFSVIEYVQYRRVIEAQKMLKDSRKDIIDIYFECGFNNVQHFYRVFKKISKITPDKYRKRYLPG